MSQREQRANDVLRALDEAHRLGRIGRDEYRRRRRELLDSLREERDGDRDTVRRAMPAHGVPVKGAAPPQRESNRAGRPRYLIRLAVFAALLGVAGLCVALAGWLVGPSL
jgi:hypothetical protein